MNTVKIGLAELPRYVPRALEVKASNPSVISIFGRCAQHNHDDPGDHCLHQVHTDKIGAGLMREAPGIADEKQQDGPGASVSGNFFKESKSVITSPLLS